MKPEATAASATAAVPGGDQRRRVRLFAALHLGAVGAIYALALFVGGGYAGPPMPATTGVASNAPVAMHAPPPLAPEAPVTTTESPLPAWARRVETMQPWEGR